MTRSELLRACADRLDTCARHPEAPYSLTLSVPRGSKFPFSGPGVELLSISDTHKNYSVPVETILRMTATRVAEDRRRRHGELRTSPRKPATPNLADTDTG